MTRLPNVAALLANARHHANPGTQGQAKRDLRSSAPVLAAALVEAADALRDIAGMNPSEPTRWYWVADAALARLVAFDASLEKTT